MVDDINALQRLELKEAFDEFDKVLKDGKMEINIFQIMLLHNHYRKSL